MGGNKAAYTARQSHGGRAHNKKNLIEFSMEENKVRVITDILKRKKIACDSQHFEGKSRFGVSGGKGGVVISNHF